MTRSSDTSLDAEAAAARRDHAVIGHHRTQTVAARTVISGISALDACQSSPGDPAGSEDPVLLERQRNQPGT